ncbi:hypothetical protein C798_20415 [Herbaspirillum rubrisubalbicans Os34]|uniref:Uncharacterized protein n=1 Tax=Herbaspirillum rubrisubalbicans Os34 TaxID=1235827 RepID=A0A6M3ZW99_9BURK|nr:hypothetical protein [Herbaspirillum rubrisubalbicans]QJQ02503.1 hypothetical protein C798_20415 [Herbaspirillum rubrisubalbicans Os34]
MPDIELPFTHPELVDALEVIMNREGFDTLEQAAEFVLAQSVREGIKRITGKGRALYAIKGKKTTCV